MVPKAIEYFIVYDEETLCQVFYGLTGDVPFEEHERLDHQYATAQIPNNELFKYYQNNVGQLEIRTERVIYPSSAEYSDETYWWMVEVDLWAYQTKHAFENMFLPELFDSNDPTEYSNPKKYVDWYQEQRRSRIEQFRFFPEHNLEYYLDWRLKEFNYLRSIYDEISFGVYPESGFNMRDKLELNKLEFFVSDMGALSGFFEKRSVPSSVLQDLKNARLPKSKFEEGGVTQNLLKHFLKLREGTIQYIETHLPSEYIR